jgi:SAM-dependent methyltransferase
MNWDPVWEKIFQEQEWGKYPAESVIQFVARNFYKRDRQNTKLLEIGCGPGANIWYMAREGFDVYCIDGSATAIEKAAKKLEQDRLKADLKVGDIARLPYADSIFDGIIDVECLCCNSRANTNNILKEIKRVLKGDGLFYSRTFTDDMYIGTDREILGPLEYNNISDGPLSGKGLVRLTNRKDIQELYGAFFKIVSIDKLEYTSHNGEIKISEWIVICRKDD